MKVSAWSEGANISMRNKAVFMAQRYLKLQKRQYIAFAIIAALLLVWAPNSFATNWYVDPAASGSNNGTSWANAWETVGAIAWGSIHGDDTLYFSGGSTSQTYTTQLSVGASGTLGHQITLAPGQDAGHTGQVIFDGGGSSTQFFINVNGNQYFTITGRPGGGTACDSSHSCPWVLQNNSLFVDAALIGGGGSPYPSSLHGIHISYIEVKHSGSGIHIQFASNSPGNSDWGELDHSYIHDITAEAAVSVIGSVYPPGASDDYSTYNLYGLGWRIHDNEIQVNNDGANDGYGPDATQATNGVDYYNNRIYGATGNTYTTDGSGRTCAVAGASACQHQDAFQIGGNFYRIYGNYSYCTANSIAESDNNNVVTGFIRIYNNVFGQCPTQIGSHGIELKTGDNAVTFSDLDIQNNTFVDRYGFPAIRFINATASAMTMQNSAIDNNIFYNSAPYSIETPWGAFCGTGLIISNNNVNAGANGSTIGQCNGVTFNDTNRQAGAPTFVIYTPLAVNTNDLHITSGSTPDIGTGLNLSTFFTTDKDGTSRPASPTAWDLGSYVSGTAPPSPQITTLSIPNGTVGTAYSSTTMAASGGFSPYTWSATGMATGLSISSGGVITGTPTVAGSYTENITVTDAHSVTAMKPFTVVISPNVTTPGGTINQGTTQQGTLSSQKPAPPTGLKATVFYAYPPSI